MKLNHPFGGRRVLIVGGGIAGICMAWRLWDLGWDFLLVDDKKKKSASLVSSGMINPITGSRLSMQRNYSRLFRESRDFYSYLESRLDRRLFYHVEICRIFANEKQSERFQRKGDRGDYRELRIGDGGRWGSWQGALVDVENVVKFSREFFFREGKFIEKKVDIRDFSQLSQGEIVWEDCNYGGIVWANGWQVADHTNSFFSPFVEHKHKKGEILTVVFENKPDIVSLGNDWENYSGKLNSRIVYHFGMMLSPVPCSKTPYMYRLGSTYDPNLENEFASKVKFEMLVELLKKQVNGKFEILDHQASIRPILNRRLPVIGRYHNHEKIFILNGLASKGTLYAPVASRLLVEKMCNQKEEMPDWMYRYVS